MNPACSEVFSIQLYVIKFVSDLQREKNRPVVLLEETRENNRPVVLLEETRENNRPVVLLKETRENN
jgi:hypothetical protein